jgi:hypothetical protein
MIDQDEDLKYTLWSEYVETLTNAGTADKPVTTMSYFEWLDFYELS